jgi:hypothetical protein
VSALADAFAALDVPVHDRCAGRAVTHAFAAAGTREVAQPVTFTPFASARPCSARCTFCSETLVHDEARVLSASLRPRPSYAGELAACLHALEGLPIGYSLSGLEATDDAAWLLDVLDVLDAHGRASPVGERVLYSNGNGLSPRTTGAHLVPRLAAFGLTRVELSRHAVAQGDNDAIMRFHAHAATRDNDAFAEAVQFARAGGLRVRLVCVVQRGGVADLDAAERYLAWARALGVDDVVFRELSRTGARYRANASLRLVDDARVPIETFLRALEGRNARAFAPIERTRGYYYENVRGTWDGVSVTFEASDYVDMKARHASGVVHKLVFHANGNLCADWDPEREVLWRAEGAEPVA